MCTVSWLHQRGGYQLFCNRDEKRTRRPASGPKMLMHDGVRVIAPIDGDFGGTWIAVNEFGMSLALLNRGPASPIQLSRGLVLVNLIAARAVSEVRDRIATFELSDFAPFTLAGLEPGSPATLFNWNGRALTVVPHADRCMPLVASSFDPEGVERERRAEFSRLQAESGGLRAGVLLAFHRSHEPTRGPHSPCMHRQDAETVSFTWVTVTPSEVNLHYATGSPCRSLAGESQTLTAVREEAAACLACC